MTEMDSQVTETRMRDASPGKTQGPQQPISASLKGAELACYPLRRWSHSAFTKRFQSEACENAFTVTAVLCRPEGPWGLKPARWPASPSSSLLLFVNRALLCVPEEMAHISLPLVLLAVQLFAPFTCLLRPQGEEMRRVGSSEKGRKPGPRARGGAKGHRGFRCERQGPHRARGSQSMMYLQMCPKLLHSSEQPGTI